ncbi:hypothetical protein [Geobacter sp. DSM 9736]|uniref:hypothetical protein n=1 Tax=Geobacter sp. DSM 9736 TaxID=1277350 RepID=UPI000B5060AC|nr:hypothetical protein [Geobacter sp. DSM 9736]SNB46374.1 hypothetical protein SAMN06269301_1829 [Geobacter sp. DSM 9736]
MNGIKGHFVLLLLGLLLAGPLHADEVGDAQGEIITGWPLFDYRESPQEGFSNLSILGPLIKIQTNKGDVDTALRPLFYRSANSEGDAAETIYLYPLARSDVSPDTSRVEVLHLLQRNVYRKNEGEMRESDSMLFPFYIRGTSPKYGPYTSVFPFYGDIYERFWKDEYHYILFPLYSRTVKKGTTNRNYLYPFFSTTEGENERGFQFWPLYGQSEKTGVYNKNFVLWPFYLREESGLDTDNPTKKLYMLPFYAASDSPHRRSRYYMWPFFGHVTDSAKIEEEWDYFWPFWRKIRGEQRNVDSYLPLYSHEQYKGRSKTWYMWPLYRHEEDNSDIFRWERDRVMFFLFSNTKEQWPKVGDERRRVALWPLFLYSRDVKGVKSLSLPALAEPIFDRDGIEKNWAPLWRVYQQKWADNGDSAVSFLWNLYWHQVRGNDLAYEFFPVISHRAEKGITETRILKGLVGYRAAEGHATLSLLWLPLLNWGSGEAGPVSNTPRSNQ